MRSIRFALFLAVVLIPSSAVPDQAGVFPYAPNDPVLAKIIEIGKSDNRVMTWLDIATNRFGGRYSGSDAYDNAAAWALWQFKQWGLEAELDEAGEVPVGFNRGPWFGKMVKPVEKALYFGTPTMTAGTKGVQHGHAVIAPAKEEEVEAMKAKLKGAWALIPGESNGMARDGRRNSQMSPLTKKMVEAGCLGTIQMSKEPIRMLDGQILKWDDLPVLPDIKLTENQYNEIKALVEKGETVELEFDIRNWFKMGPVKYDNIVAWIPGTTHPDEWIVLGGHFDSYDASTGAVDDGSGFTPMMEALRIIKAAGGKPKRSIMAILFAAEENGILGSQAWLKRHPDKQGKILVMINRDGSPSAVVGATVPPLWYPDFLKIAEPLKTLHPQFPFELREDEYPRAKAERPTGTDSSAFSMLGIPTLSVQTKTDYVYSRAWHTLLDTYNEVAPYAEHQKHSALATAVLAYGIANLDKSLSREGVYLPDGLYADMNTAAGRLLLSLDFRNAPAPTAQFLRIIEGEGAPAGGPAKPPAPAGPPPQAGVPAGMAGQRPQPAPIGRILEVKGGLASGIIVSDVQKAVAGVILPKATNPALKHDSPGVLGMTYENRFYLTLAKKPDLDAKYPAIGKLIAGAGVLKKMKAEDAVRSVRIIRVGQAAREFKTDNATFQKLLEKSR